MSLLAVLVHLSDRRASPMRSHLAGTATQMHPTGQNQPAQESHAAEVTHRDVGHADDSIAPLAFGLVQGAIGFVEQFVDALIR